MMFTLWLIVIVNLGLTGLLIFAMWQLQSVAMDLMKKEIGKQKDVINVILKRLSHNRGVR